uniref:Bromo domain-containing protein n=1 Tax=Pseudo-nitzschia australis TaxID=44445 RepID=A0A7S4AEH9_9STRA
MDATMSNSNGMNGKSSSSAKENGEIKKESQDTKVGKDVVMEDASASVSASDKTKTNSNNNNNNNNGTSNKGSTAAAGSNGKTASASASTSTSPPPPVLRGTLSYNAEPRQHLIRGMWNYENSNAFPPQKFELVRNLTNDEADGAEVLPKDGEFHGSFSLAYFHTTSKGKQKERSKVIAESGVKIKFTKIESSSNDDDDYDYNVDGTGVNQFGIFHINGTAKPTTHGDGQYSIELRKRYDAVATAAAGNSNAAATKKAKKQKRNSLKGAAAQLDNIDPSKLPPPSKSFEKNVVCLRGKLTRGGADGDDDHDGNNGNGNGNSGYSDPLFMASDDLVHKISGMWSSGLDLLVSDPENTRGLCNRFEYEHKSSNPNASFPVSGRYSGWFDLNNEKGGKTKINETDITLRFRRNNAGYHNVEGKGSNAFGKYTITGTLTKDNIVTIFRHFIQKKSKASSSSSASVSASSRLPVTSAPPPLNAPGQPRTASPHYGSSGAAPAAKQLSLDDVVVPGNDDNDNDNDGTATATPAEPLKPPDLGTYTAVFRGVLRANEDGSHSCQGKWAITREHFTSGQTSNCAFRLESHHAEQAIANSENGGGARHLFPLDSDRYKGSFQLKKGGSRYQIIIDTQMVMKFRENTSGTFNVYGKGVNEIGIFKLTGTLIASGKTGGQVELYRVYPPELLTTATPASASSKSKSKKSAGLPAGSNLPPALAAKNFNNMGQGGNSYSTMMPGPPRAGAASTKAAYGSMSRRESTRVVKVPSRLEDEDPNAQFSRIMDKCNVLLRIIREKDVEMGAFFSEPVDPVALNIPTYLQVIKEPMDLRTLNRKMEGNDVKSPEEFARLCRLIFENAVMFNVDPSHSVHQAARTLLILFNQKYRDIERQVANLRRVGIQEDSKGKKGDKKRKRGGSGGGAQESEVETKSLKRRRLDEAHEMALANSHAMSSLIGAAPHPSTNDAGVTRKEFNIMLNVIQKLQHQVVKTYTMLAELSSDDPGSGAGLDSPDPVSSSTKGSGAAAIKKKPKKKPEPPKPPEKKKPQPEPVIPEDDTIPLTLAEQEFLTESIPGLPQDNLQGVIQIIREAAKLTGEEDEIDLEIDQLDTPTQRKLLRYVTKVRNNHTRGREQLLPRHGILPFSPRLSSLLMSDLVRQAQAAEESTGEKDKSTIPTEQETYSGQKSASFKRTIASYACCAFGKTKVGLFLFVRQ